MPKIKDDIRDFREQKATSPPNDLLATEPEPAEEAIGKQEKTIQQPKHQRKEEREGVTFTPESEQPDKDQRRPLIQALRKYEEKLNLSKLPTIHLSTYALQSIVDDFHQRYGSLS